MVDHGGLVYDSKHRVLKGKEKTAGQTGATLCSKLLLVTTMLAIKMHNKIVCNVLTFHNYVFSVLFSKGGTHKERGFTILGPGKKEKKFLFLCFETPLCHRSKKESIPCVALVFHDLLQLTIVQ